MHSGRRCSPSTRYTHIRPSDRNCEPQLQNRFSLLQCLVAMVQTPQGSSSFMAFVISTVCTAALSEYPRWWVSVVMFHWNPPPCCLKLQSNSGHQLCPISENYTFQGSAISVGQNFLVRMNVLIFTVPLILSLSAEQNKCHS